MKCNKDTFCLAPWYEIRINSDGSVKYCQLTKEVSRADDFVHWFNKSEIVQQSRRQLINGESLKGCAICYEQDKLQMYSARQRRNFEGAIHEKYFDESLKQSPVLPRLQSTEKTKPSYIHVSFNNLCNLSCRTCLPRNSTKLTQNLKKLNIIPIETPTLVDWTNNTVLWDSFLSLIDENKSLLSLHVMGGEPLYNDRFEKMIDWCIDTGNTDFCLSFVSNATIYSDELFEKFSHFKTVQIELSIENLHETNEFIRLGSSTEKVKNNILQFINNKPENTNVYIRTVPQALSVEHYDTLIDFVLENKLVIDHNSMFDTDHLCIDVLPKEYKSAIAEKIRIKYLDILQGSNSIDDLNLRNESHYQRSLKVHLEYVLHMLEKPEPINVEDLRKQFVSSLMSLETLYPKRFVELYPKLKDFYEKYS